MSKIAYKTPITGTGVFTIESPATNIDRTLTLPDAGGQLHTSESVNDHVSMPTVAGDPIVASGSNTDGEWTRFADGTQVCTRNVTLDLTITTNQYRGPYAQPFNAAHIASSWGPDRAASIEFADQSALRNAYASARATVWLFNCDGGGTNTALAITLFAFGRWK